MTKRLFIVSDILKKEELEDVQDEVADLLEDQGIIKPAKDVFDQTIDFGWHDLKKTWEAVSSADEIYASSTFIPLCNNANMGAPVIINEMMKIAIQNNIKGKKLIVLNSLKRIYWYYVDKKLLKKCFSKNNQFYTCEYDEDAKRVITLLDPKTIK